MPNGYVNAIDTVAMQAILRQMSQDTSEPVLLSRRELAARWHCHVDTIKRRETEGLVHPVVVGHKRLYKLSEIQRIEATP